MIPSVDNRNFIESISTGNVLTHKELARIELHGAHKWNKTKSENGKENKQNVAKVATGKTALILFKPENKLQT